MVVARSLTNKTGQLEALLLCHSPHLTVVTETWLHSEIPDDNLVPPGYKIFRRDQPTRGGGVAVILNSSIKASLLAQSPGTESLCLRVSFGDRVINIITVYRPPDSCELAIPYGLF